MLKNMETTLGRVILGDIASWRGVIDIYKAVREGSEACFSLPLPRGKNNSPYSADTSLSPLQLIAARAVDAFENCATTTALTSRVPLC